MKFSFWDILAWAALISIAIWVILKALGIINTLLILEYYPILAAIYAFGWQMHKLQNIEEEVKSLKGFKEATINEIHEIKTNCKLNHK